MNNYDERNSVRAWLVRINVSKKKAEVMILPSFSLFFPDTYSFCFGEGKNVLLLLLFYHFSSSSSLLLAWLCIPPPSSIHTFSSLLSRADTKQPLNITVNIEYAKENILFAQKVFNFNMWGNTICLVHFELLLCFHFPLFYVPLSQPFFSRQVAK